MWLTGHVRLVMVFVSYEQCMGNEHRYRFS